MKLSVGMFTLAAAVLTSSVARADGPPQDAPPVRSQLEVGFGALWSSNHDTSLLQTRFTLAPTFTFRDTFMIAPMLRMTHTGLDLRQKDGLPFDASLSLPWQPSLGARVGVRLFRYRWFSMEARGEFEFPLGENQGYVDSFTPRDRLTSVPIDVDTLRNHVTVSHGWYTIQGSVRLRADYHWWHPYIDLGYLTMQSRLAVNFDPTASGLLNTANVHPARFYDSSESTVFYVLGSDFDLGRGFGLRVNCTLLPMPSTMLFTGEVGLLVPLDFSGR